MHPLPLKWRVGLCVMLLVAVVVAAISAVAYYEFRETLLKDLDHSLRSKVSQVTSALASGHPMEAVGRQIEFVVGSAGSVRSPVYRLWLDGQQQDLLASTWLQHWPLGWQPDPRAAPRPGEDKTLDVTRSGKVFRLVWARCPDPRGQSPSRRLLNIVVGAYSGHVNHEASEFFQVLLILAGSIVLASVVVTIWLVHWGLKPIARLTHRMGHITGANLDRSPAGNPPVPAELRPFVEAWEQMLERLAWAMREQRRFTADASHELRTPLAIVKSTLQAARSRRRTAETYEKAMDHALEDLARLERLIEQLLAIARLDEPADESAWAPIALDDLVAEVCEQYAPFAGERLGHLPHGTLQIRQHVTQPVGIVLGQMESVPLPVQLDPVPVIEAADFSDVGQAVLSHLRHGHVPR